MLKVDNASQAAGGERRRSRLLKRTKESGWCLPTIASARAFGGQFTVHCGCQLIASGLGAPHR